MADLHIERGVVTGGRGFTDPGRIAADLQTLMHFGLRRVAEGQSPGSGADDFAHDAWLLLTGESTKRYPANVGIDGPGRGRFPRRNIRMLEAERPDLVLAYPDELSRGTWHCVREACNRGITTIVWAPFCEVYDFMGEDSIKPGIYVDGPNGHVIRIDDQRRESHGRADDGGWASLTLIEGSSVPHSSRFAVCVFDREEQTEAIMAALGDASAAR